MPAAFHQCWCMGITVLVITKCKPLRAGPDWDAAMQAALSPPVQASAQPGGADGSALQHLRLLQLLVQHSAAWQAQLLLQSGASGLQCAPGGAPHLEQSLSSDIMAATACQPVGDASSQCCEYAFRTKRARDGSAQPAEAHEDEEVISSAAALPQARAQRPKRARATVRHH